MMDSMYLFMIGGSTLVTFLLLGFLLWEKRIDSDNTVFVACVVVMTYIVSVVGLLPPTANDKVVFGLVSIGSAIVGFLSRGLVGSSFTHQKASEILAFFGS